MFIEQAFKKAFILKTWNLSLLILSAAYSTPVFLLAQPYIPGAQSESATRHVIIIDNSYYNAQNLNYVKALAISILDKLPEGSAVKLAGTQFKDEDFLLFTKNPRKN